mmetsp:Transcript_25114/g.49949  ORF Transcript_25114/g.49949 Transcript_25114/m.49949 type:complete len:255 (+) Transcript_25114:129-893(+)
MVNKETAVSPEELVSSDPTFNKGKYYIKNASEKVEVLATTGPFSFKVMGYLGGMAMTCSSFLDILGQFVLFHPINALVSIYTFMFGLIVILLEGKELSSTVTLKRTIEHYAKFLEFIWGRGLLYFFAGSLQFARLGVLNFLVGGFMIIWGIIIIAFGQSTADRLNKILFHFGDKRAVEQQFNALDLNADGYISAKEFHMLTKNLGVQLEHDEVKAVVSVIGNENTGKISFEEFYDWWSGSDQILELFEDGHFEA